MVDVDVSDVKNRATKSVKWTALTELVFRSIPPLVMLILARLLTPEDFGIVGVAMIAIGFAQVFQDFGLGKTLIQREDRINESANIVFWSNVTFGVLLYLILFLSASPIADFFHELRVKDVLRVLCLQIVLTSFTTVHLALLQREFRFKQLFVVRLAPSIIPGFVSIPLALMGHGVWALVWGSLAGSFVQVLLFWHVSDWRPAFSFDIALAREVLGFGSWVALEMFLGWLIMWGDSIMLGHFLGVNELGIYRVGTTVILLIFSLFFSPLIPVAYSSFSRLQSNTEDLRASFLRMTQLVATVSLPLGVGLALTAHPISSLVFGYKWQGIVIVILIIGLKESMSWLVSMNTEVYRAVGRPDANAKLHMVNVIYYIPVYVLAAPYGLLVFCLARFAVAAVSLLLHFYVANKLLQLPFTYLRSCVKSPLIASLTMAVLLYGIVNLTAPFEGWGGLLKLIAVIIGGGISYLVVLRLVDKDLLMQFFRLLREAIK